MDSKKQEQVTDQDKDQQKQTDEVKNKEPEAKGQQYIQVTHPITGEVQNLTGEEAMQFINYGMSKLSEEQDSASKEAEDKKEKESTDERVARLEAKIKENEEKATQEKRISTILTTLDKSAAKFDITKNGSPLAEKIKIIALARLQQNPRLDAAEVFASEVNDFMEVNKTREELLKGQTNANQKVKDAVSGTIRGGGLPTIDTEKEYKAEDLKRNVSREALRKFLEASEA